LTIQNNRIEQYPGNCGRGVAFEPLPGLVYEDRSQSYKINLVLKKVLIVLKLLDGALPQFRS